MQQQSLYEWSNVYWRCERVHLWLCRWLHGNALRDRYIIIVNSSRSCYNYVYYDFGDIKEIGLQASKKRVRIITLNTYKSHTEPL